jgi:hypothetical protein
VAATAALAVLSAASATAPAAAPAAPTVAEAVEAGYARHLHDPVCHGSWPAGDGKPAILLRAFCHIALYLILRAVFSPLPKELFSVRAPAHSSL